MRRVDTMMAKALCLGLYNGQDQSFSLSQDPFSQCPSRGLWGQTTAGNPVGRPLQYLQEGPCAAQYCYSHLRREVGDIEKELSEAEEVKTFVSVQALLLAKAMHLHSLPIIDAQFYEQAAKVKNQIIEVVHASAQHLAVRGIQEIFHDHADRMYRRTDDRRIPADNNLAEINLRTTIIPAKSALALSPMPELRPEAF